MHHGETGFSNEMYNLISVQYHALKGGQTYGKYIEDAQSAGQQDLVDFFTQVQQEDATRAQRCHELLAKLSGASDSGSTS